MVVRRMCVRVVGRLRSYACVRECTFTKVFVHVGVHVGASCTHVQR